jgi:hypothetical protein
MAGMTSRVLYLLAAAAPPVFHIAEPIRMAQAAGWDVFNTVNSWALGLTSSFIVGFVAEAIGKGIPLVAMPCVNQAFVAHPQFGRSVETLRGAGVTMLYGEGGFVPNRPGEGRPEAYPWGLALEAAGRAVGAAS